jgi:F420H(2)-dependent quinone reductase
VNGTTTRVTGTEVTGAERERLWQVLNDQVFDYDAYQQKVSRQIAVVALAPIA